MKTVLRILFIIGKKLCVSDIRKKGGGFLGSIGDRRGWFVNFFVIIFWSIDRFIF